MAFPTIQTADTKNGTVASNSNSWTLTYPTNLQANDLILAFVATDGNTAPTWPGGWGRKRAGSSAAVSCHVGAKLSDGTETGTFSLGLSANEQGGWRIFRITGQFVTSIIDGVSEDCIANTSGSGASSTPDPPSLDPTSWDVEDTLWFAVCAVDTSRTISVYPLADNQTADVSGGANGATLGVCTLNDAVASKDPGTFTISASDDWVTVTLAVRPAAAATPASLLLPNRSNLVVPRQR